MKRFLSMALAVVLLLSALPMVSAEACADDAHVWVDDAMNTTDYVAPTCTEPGVQPQKCSVEGCGATRNNPIEKLGHTVPEDRTTWLTITPASCAAAGEIGAECSVCHVTVKEAVAALGHSFTSGNCSNEGCTVKENTLYSASITNATVKIGTPVALDWTISAKAEGKDDVAAAAAPVGFSSSDETVATVTSAGIVTGLKVGSATITGTFSVGTTTIATTATVTVENESVIVCANEEKMYSYGATIDLNPTLQDTNITGVTYRFEVVSGTATVNATTGVVTAVDDGESAIKITATWGSNPVRTATKTVYVSFFLVADDISITLNDNVKMFYFDDTGAFFNATIGTTSVKNITKQSVLTLLPIADYSSMAVSGESVGYTSVGKLSNSLYVDVLPATIAPHNILFTVLGEGSYEFAYELYSASGNLLAIGSVTIETQDVSADITYTTTFNKKIQFAENDFIKLWNGLKMDGSYSYVQFTDSPDYGILYTDSDVDDAVATSDRFYFSGTSDRLRDVTYEPTNILRIAHTATIPFTIFGTRADEYAYGVLQIKVGEEMSFTDVKKTDYFYDAVVWAVGEGITSGTSATTFSPNATCTRAQVVTFLYRAAGEPTVSGSMPFTDVKLTDYYYDAVLWAYKNDITTGLTATTFGPNSTVTRGQVVTFLCRALEGKASSSYNPFTDVKSTDYFYDAVLWAVKNDVTTGLTATTFGPNSGCTRGQIVTFLYRAYEGE